MRAFVNAFKLCNQLQRWEPQIQQLGRQLRIYDFNVQTLHIRQGVRPCNSWPATLDGQQRRPAVRISTVEAGCDQFPRRSADHLDPLNDAAPDA